MGSVYTEAGTMSLSDAHKHVLACWAVWGALGLDGALETKLEDRPGGDMGPQLYYVLL